MAATAAALLLAVAPSATAGPLTQASDPTTSTTSTIPDIAARGAQESGFIQTCVRETIGVDVATSPIFGRYTLIANCYTVDGRVRGSKLDMQFCLGNNDGTLEFAELFAESCDLRSVTLRIPLDQGQVVSYGINCLKPDGSLNFSTVDLNAVIGNTNGTLSCFGIPGRDGEPF
ncbi:hypothetical protein Micbo1qcDRAFT_179190 [Microdochium bolleyi]|uniref:Cyanovirin-N domain-containing protein n=1 Tax=Microdochium bolleyi TaxID=196109 RepID=A0A136IQV6_9PEZI|nr:hypothetical protein Micbo1qcDRAFT_179190 [Microdochium bolleyi]